jgi:hypothetical protein
VEAVPTTATGAEGGGALVREAAQEGIDGGVRPSKSTAVF